MANPRVVAPPSARYLDTQDDAASVARKTRLAWLRNKPTRTAAENTEMQNIIADEILAPITP